MMYFNLLFGDKEKHISQDAIDDMLFAEFLDTVFKNDKVLYDCFIGVLSTPLTTIIDIKKRQRILGELLPNRVLVEKMIEICRQGSSVQRESRTSIYQKIDALTRMKLNIKAVEKIFDCVELFGSLIANYHFESPELNEIQRYFTRTNEHSELRMGLLTMAFNYMSPSVFIGNIKFNEMSKFKCITMCEIDRRATKKHTRLAFKRGFTINYNDDKNIDHQLEHIIEKAQFDYCKVLSEVYIFYRNLFESLKNQLEFYLAAIIYIQYLKDNHFLYSFPKITDQAKTINAKNLYFLPLAIKNKAKDICPNDFCSENNSVFIITGYNRGGKTTFLRSIGFAQIIAQAGLPVPAVEYECSVFNFIMTHFPKNEDKQLAHGMFEEEVAVLRTDLDYIKTNAIVLLNESFSTTVEREGQKVARDVIKAFSETDSLVLFVTHFYNLAINMGKTENVVNLVTEKYEQPNARQNYRIVRGEPISKFNVRLSDFF